MQQALCSTFKEASRLSAHMLPYPSAQRPESCQETQPFSGPLSNTLPISHRGHCPSQYAKKSSGTCLSKAGLHFRSGRGWCGRRETFPVQESVGSSIKDIVPQYLGGWVLGPPQIPKSKDVQVSLGNGRGLLLFFLRNKEIKTH